MGRVYFVPVVRSVAARRGVFGVSVVLAVGLFAAACQPAKPPPPPPPPPDFQPGFQESVVFGGLSTPTVVAFSPDGRVFVGEKSGIIKVFDNLSDPTPTIFADLRTNVYDYWDRGLLGMALDPSFPAKPYVYVLYTRDAVIGGAAPLWSDDCPTPPGPVFGAGCQASGRLSRLQASGNQMVGSEQVLVDDWCQQFPSHSVGTVSFGADGALYAGAGDGASFAFADWGSGDNPCGDPPNEGGALRAQDLRTGGDPVGLDGSIIRVNPDTGDAVPSNPLSGSADLNARRVIAYGMRNPFRFTTRPGTGELWVADVGWNDVEEINRIPSATDAMVENFGWPCYEGPGHQPGYDAAALGICENLYASPGSVAAPYYSYSHNEQVVASEPCSTDAGSAITGPAFYGGGNYPADYQGALFFGDYVRNCIWAMFPGPNGLPNPATRVTFRAHAAGPVDIKIGPGGDLFYVDIQGGTIRRIQFSG